MNERSPKERLRAHVAAAATKRVIAVGWATVDLDRAAREVGAALGLAPERFEDARGSSELGAHCRIAVGALDGAVTVVLMEPSTEFRLAAALARHDEGPIAVWLSELDATQGSGRSGSGAQAGPFGPERLEGGGPPQGPYRLVLTGPGTIAP